MTQSTQTKSPLLATSLRFVAFGLLMAIIILPRAWPFPNAFFSDDEMQIGRWTGQMTRALLAADWQNTANNAYPAVTLAWMEAVQVGLTKLLPQQSLTSMQMVSDAGDDVFAALARRRLALALINSALIVAAFWLLRRLYNNFIAVAATILMALDPFLLTQSRVFRTEGLTTGLMLVAGLTIILYVKEKRKGWLITSAILSALATLTKITSLFLFPFAGLTLHLWPLIAGQRQLWPLIKQIARDLAWWSVALLLTIFLLWPALWVAPIATLGQTLNYVQQAAVDIETVWGGDDSAVFFNGEILREDPGAMFYVWSVAYRTTPVVMLGAIALLGGSVLLIRRRQRKVDYRPYSLLLSAPYPAITLLLLAYVFFYFVAMSLGASKWDRYLLPIFPGLSILAAVGIQLIIDLFTTRISLSKLQWWVWGGLVVVSTWLALPQHPYYFTYWNPLLGGSQQGIKILPAGGRPGINMMVEYLNALPNASELSVVGPGLRDCPVIFSGSCHTPERFLLADYIVGDIFSLQKGAYLSDIPAIFPRAERIYAYTNDGVDYAWLYKIPPGFQQTEQWLGTHGKLRGYGFSAAEIGAGDSVNVALYWINGDQGWTLSDSEFFVKVTDEYGRVQQTVPARPRDKANPREPGAGDMLIFDADVNFPPTATLGNYALDIGLRLKETGQETWVFTEAESANTVAVNRGARQLPADALAIQHWLNQSLNSTGLTLLGYDDLITGESPRLDFYWQAEQPVVGDYLMALILLNDLGEAVASWSDTVSPKIHPLSDWQAGETVKRSIPLAVGYTLPQNSYRPVLQILPASNPTAPLATIELAPLPAQFNLMPPAVNMQHRLEQATFDHGLDLLGYDLWGKGNSVGGTLLVTLYWLNRWPLEPAEVEIQVLDKQGNSISQALEPISDSPNATVPWQNITQAELPLNQHPDTVVIRAYRSSDAWSPVYKPASPTVQQIIVDDVLNKTTPVSD